jgi:cofilin
MSSGVGVSTDVKSAFEDQLKKHAYNYIIYQIVDERTIVVETKGGSDASYDDFLSNIPPSACRYATINFPVTVDGGELWRPTLITWAPEDAPIKQRKIYASTYDALKKSLVGVYSYINALDSDELSADKVMGDLRKKLGGV